MCPLAFFRYFLSDSGAFSNSGSMMVSDYDKKVSEFEKAPESEKKVPEFEKAPKSDKKYLKKARGHISRNVVQITIKMRTIVQIILVYFYLSK